MRFYKALCVSVISSVLLSTTTINASENVIPVHILQPEESVKEITISFAGDCTLGGYKGQGVGNQFNDYFNEYGADYFFENVRPIFENDDLTFVNLEGPLTNYPQTAVKKFPIKGNVECVEVLSGSSVEVCNLANNHTYDCGEAGYNETLSLLQQDGIGYCGNGSVSRQIVDGVQVSFLGYNGWSASEELLTAIKADITAEREAGSSIICVMFHWGEERKHYSNSIQEIIAHFTIDAGADIVIGGHPHVLQGIEKYKGKTIVYSLGNFSFGANKNPKDKDTVIFQQTFKVDSTGVATYVDESIVACSISSIASKNDYKPTPLTGNEAIRVINRLKQYSSKYNNTLDVLK